MSWGRADASGAGEQDSQSKRKELSLSSREGRRRAESALVCEWELVRREWVFMACLLHFCGLSFASSANL